MIREVTIYETTFENSLFGFELILHDCMHANANDNVG